MKSPFKLILSLLLVTLFALSPAFATCGGGGGGGVGGISSGGGAEKTYPVPWKVHDPKEPSANVLVLYWFPRSDDEIKTSSLRQSRVLSLYAAQCVSMEMADYRTPEGQKILGDSKPPLAVLATHDGAVIAKAESKDGMLKVEQVEKLVSTEWNKREEAVDASLKDGRDKAKAGDNETAIKLFRSALEQKCMFPKKAKDAAKELKKLGVSEVAFIPDAAPTPVFDPRVSARIERLMRAGLRAEIAARYADAERLYAQAHRLDPADPAPLRYLGELYRHNTGDWTRARAMFEAILSMPADPLSRAVAQHGLGKITIHDGDFKKGLQLLEASVSSYPLALAYRNLAVFWNSEGDRAKADLYTQKALALDPQDPYNLIFAAAFMAGNGHGEEALKIARENEKLLAASYNLAAIYAQMGERDKALALLRRHFFEYERFHAVRTKEMMEARVDAVFASLREDPAFVALTRDADGKLPLSGAGATGMRPSSNR